MHQAGALGMLGVFRRRAGEHAVPSQQAGHLARELEPAVRQHDQVVGHPVQLGQHVRGQHHRDTVPGHRGQHRGHEIAPGHRIQRGQWLVQHQQPGVPGQRHGQRELSLLAAGQLACLPVQRDAQLSQPGLGPRLIPLPVQVAGHLQHGRHRQVLVQRRVLGHERGPVQRARRPGGLAAEHADRAGRRGHQADRHVQQRGLARAVRADQGDQVPVRDGQRAVPQRPGPPVALAEPGGLDDVHAVSFRGQPPRRRAGAACDARSGCARRDIRLGRVWRWA
jgi:hypothetical protein